MFDRKRHYQQNKKRYYLSTIKSRKANPARHLLNSARYRARKRHLDFSLCVEDIKIPEYCPYLGIELTTMEEIQHKDCAATIDRIDNTKGYTRDNIQVISYLANRIKTNATKEQLITFAKAFLKLEDLPSI